MTLEEEGSIKESDLTFQYVFLGELIHDDKSNSFISSIKHYFNRISSWLLNRCQITSRNGFKEVGLNWYSTFPRDEMLSKFVSKKRKLVIADDVVVSGIVIPPPPQPQEEEIIQIPPQVEEVKLPKHKNKEKFGSRTKKSLASQYNIVQ